MADTPRQKAEAWEIGTGMAELVAGIFSGSPTLLIAGGLSFLHGVADILHRTPKHATQGVDLGTNKSDTISGLPLIFGSTRVGVQKVAIKAIDPTYLWMACAIGQGPVSSIGAVYFDDVMAIDANGRSVIGITPTRDYSKVAACWKAYGTQNQRGIVPMPRGAKTVTASARIDGNQTRITTSTAHGYTAGEVVVGTGVAGMQGLVGYIITTINSATQFTFYNPKGTTNVSGGGGTVEYYTPQAGVFAGEFDAAGQGIPHLWIRLTYDEQRFPNGIPKITVDVTGGGALDPRTANAKVISAGTAVTVLTWPAEQLVIIGHGFAEGDTILVAGTGTALDGVQRVDRVVDADHIQMFTGVTPAIGGGTATKLVSNANPMLAVREILKSSINGVGAADSEIDDTAFAAQADFCDALVFVPVSNTAVFTNTKTIVGTTPSGGTTNVNVVGHGYTAGLFVLITGTGIVALDGLRHLITLVTDADNFVIGTASVGSAVAGSTQQQLQQKRFELGGTVDGNGTVKSTLEMLLSGCRGTLVWQQGKYSPSIRDVASPVMTLDENVIVGDWRFVTPGQNEKVNVVRATFVNPSNNYQMDQVEWPPAGQVNQYLIDDQNQLNRADLDLSVVGNYAQASQIAMVRRAESRVAVQVEVTCRESVLKCTVNDLVSITHTTPGWVAQPAWISAMVPAGNGLVRVGLELYAASSYSLDNLGDIPFHTQTSLPDPLAVDPPTSLVATSFVDRRAMSLTWVASDTANVHRYDVQYKKSVDTQWLDAKPVDGSILTAEVAEDLSVGTAYDFQVRARTIAGGVSTWLTLTNQPLGQLPGPPVISASITAAGTVLVAVTASSPTGPIATCGFRIAGAKTTPPVEATVDAQAFHLGTSFSIDLGSLGGIAAGDVVYVAAKCYPTSATTGGSILAIIKVGVPAANPPVPSVRISNQTPTRVNVSFDAVVDSGQGPVVWQYRLLSNENGYATAWTGPFTGGLPAVVGFAKSLLRQASVEFQVTQVDGQSIIVAFNVQGSITTVVDGSSGRTTEDDARSGTGGLPISKSRLNPNGLVTPDGSAFMVDPVTGFLTSSAAGPSGVSMTTVEDGGVKGHGGFTSNTGDLVSTAKDSRASLVNNHFRNNTDSTDSVVDGTGSPISGGKRGQATIDSSNRVKRGNGFDDGDFGARATNNTGLALHTSVVDSRASLVSGHFRLNTDSTDSVVDGTGSPISGGKRGQLGLNSSNRLLLGVDAAATGSDGFANIESRRGASKQGGYASGGVTEGYLRGGFAGLPTSDGMFIIPPIYDGTGTKLVFDPLVTDALSSLRTLGSKKDRAKMHQSSISAQVIPNNTTTKLNWNVVDFDAGPGAPIADTANMRFNIPADHLGLWLIHARVEWGVNAVGYRFLQINSSTAAVGLSSIVNAGGVVDTVQDAWAMVNDPAAGEWFEVDVTQNSGGNITVQTPMTTFEIFHIW